MATEKLAEGIRGFAADTVKVNEISQGKVPVNKIGIQVQ